MTLTVREKQHWKEHIACKIAQATDALLARNHPDYLTEVAVQARREALRALGIEELMRRREELQASQKQLESDMTLATRKLLTDLLAGELTALQQQSLQSVAVESDQP